VHGYNLHMVPLVPLHMSHATILRNQKSGPLVYPGQLQQSFKTNDKKRQLDRDRAPQLCSTRGHLPILYRSSRTAHLMTCFYYEYCHVDGSQLKNGVRVQNAWKEQKMFAIRNLLLLSNR
jgi:hypothetical protein